jgi:hypothetical protein
MIGDMRIIDNYELITTSKFIIYGCGSGGKNLFKIMRMIGCNIRGFCDSNIHAEDDQLYGVNIYNKSKLKDLLDADTYIIVASAYFEEIINDLVLYVPDNKIITKFAFLLALHFNYKKMKIVNGELLKEYMEMWKSTGLQNLTTFSRKESYDCYLDLQDQAVFVYQCGKVGSTTLCDSLEAAGIRSSHCHTLVEYSSNEAFLSECSKLRDDYRGKMIIPVREPIARDISQYFQLLQFRLELLCGECEVDGLMSGFLKLFYDPICGKQNYNGTYIQAERIFNECKRGQQYTWFDLELKKYFGVDVFEYPFDTEKGYSVINTGKFDIMLLQLEKMNELQSEIGDFLGIPQFKFLSSNRGEAKEYKFLYQEFKENLKLPKGYVDFYYKNNKDVTHFYSEEQVEKFYEKWKKYV